MQLCQDLLQARGLLLLCLPSAGEFHQPRYLKVAGEFLQQFLAPRNCLGVFLLVHQVLQSLAFLLQPRESLLLFVLLLRDLVKLARGRIVGVQFQQAIQNSQRFGKALLGQQASRSGEFLLLLLLGFSLAHGREQLGDFRLAGKLLVDILQQLQARLKALFGQQAPRLGQFLLLLLLGLRFANGLEPPSDFWLVRESLLQLQQQSRALVEPLFCQQAPCLSELLLLPLLGLLFPDGRQQPGYVRLAWKLPLQRLQQRQAWLEPLGGEQGPCFGQFLLLLLLNLLFLYRVAQPGGLGLAGEVFLQLIKQRQAWLEPLGGEQGPCFGQFLLLLLLGLVFANCLAQLHDLSLTREFTSQRVEQGEALGEFLLLPEPAGAVHHFPEPGALFLALPFPQDFLF